MDRYKTPYLLLPLLLHYFASLFCSDLIQRERYRETEPTTEKMSGVKIIGGGGKKSYNGVSDIPTGSRKMVQSLKEIVNCPEAEIYAVLKDCNMDPNEAVNRLLSQGLSFFRLDIQKSPPFELCAYIRGS